MVLAVNALVAAMNAYAARACFEADRPGWGWANLVFSAANVACVLNGVFA